MAEIQPSLNERLIAAQCRMAAEAERIARPTYDAYLREDEQVIAELLAEPGNEDAAPAPSQRRRTRGTSAETDRNAIEASRLWGEGLMTQAQIAERMSVSMSTVKRWLKRAKQM